MLRPNGRLVYADSSGRLPRIGTCPSGPWATAAHQLADQCQSALGSNLIAVALRGSVARQTMVDTASDIDMVLVTQDPADPPTGLNASIMPNVAVDVVITTLDNLLHQHRMAWLRFTLAFSGCTVWGDDILAKLPEPYLGTNAGAHLHGVKHWSAWQQIFDAAADDIARQHICQWLMKRVVRSLFESVKVDLGAYSRDIYPCAMTAADAYPAYATAIWLAAELAVAPTADKQVIAEAAAELIPLVTEQAAKLHPLPPLDSKPLPRQ